MATGTAPADPSAWPTRSWPNCCPAPAPRRRPDLRSRQGQSELEDGAAARMGGGAERPAVPLDDGAGDRQAEAGVLLARVGVVGTMTEEALEHATQVLGRDAGTVV